MINNLGNLYANQGKLDEAEKMYLRALEGREKALGAEHTLLLETVTNLGNLYLSQGKLALYYLLSNRLAEALAGTRDSPTSMASSWDTCLD
jgi:tetratricopeptide (TPR) repeat protein